MVVSILMFFLVSTAQAACELVVTADGKTAKALLVEKGSTADGSYYEANAGEFLAMVSFDRQNKVLSATVTGPTAGTYSYKMTAADFIEELDCFGGGPRKTRFKFKCESREWRALKLKNSWHHWCVPE